MRCEDKNRTNSPELSAEHVATNNTCSIEPHDTIKISDLYSIGHQEVTKTQLENGEAVPFIHRIELDSPKGEIIRIRALFDDGAMVSAMCTLIFQKVKHQLHNLMQSNKHLCMADGSIIRPIGKWTGTIRIKGIKTQSTFEVFDSGKSWGFVLGKPTLHVFTAVHDYKTDTISIADEGGTITLDNQIAEQRLIQRGDNINLTLDEKQKVIQTRRVEQRNEDPKSVTMRQWRPTAQYFERKKAEKSQRIREEKEIERKWETTVGSETLPSREVELIAKAAMCQGFDINDLAEQAANVNVLVDQETEEEMEGQLLEELPELRPIASNASIYTRQTDPFNPARVKEILHQITLREDLSRDE